MYQQSTLKTHQYEFCLTKALSDIPVCVYLAVQNALPASIFLFDRLYPSRKIVDLWRGDHSDALLEFIKSTENLSVCLCL